MSAQENAAPRMHAYSGPAVPQLPEPTYAERVRTLIAFSTIATLSSVSERCPGYPFGSLMPFALDAEGRPIFLISTMAMHTRNLKADPRASLFISQAAEGDPLGTARATLVGDVKPVPEDALADVRERYLARYENSRSWVDFKDFAFYRLEPLEVYFVGGFGVMGWVSAADYLAAEVDPLAAQAAHILAHMNADHVDAMILLAGAHSGITARHAAMTAVDRLGFYLRLETAEGVKGTRINFPHAVANADQSRAALVEMVRAAR